MALKTCKSLTVAEMEKMKVLLANGMTFNAVAKELKRSPHTIKKYAITPETSKEIKVIKQELSIMYEELSRRMISSISDQDIRQINCYQRVVASGIATDKYRLLSDKSTENISVRGHAQELNAMIEALENELKLRDIVDDGQR